jgi:phage baseplate assembly protein W
MTEFVDFPYQFDGRGLTATTALENHVRDLIEQVLFTSPGERVMRPDFGSGILELVFEPNSTALAATTQMLVQGALQQYLSHLIAVQGVDVENVDSALMVTVRYAMLRDRSTYVASFTVPGSGA